MAAKSATSNVEALEDGWVAETLTVPGEDSVLYVFTRGAAHEVWLAVDGSIGAEDVRESNVSFCIGAGPKLEEALADAVRLTSKLRVELFLRLGRIR